MELGIQVGVQGDIIEFLQHIVELTVKHHRNSIYYSIKELNSARASAKEQCTSTLNPVLQGVEVRIDPADGVVVAKSSMEGVCTVLGTRYYERSVPVIVAEAMLSECKAGRHSLCKQVLEHEKDRDGDPVWKIKQGKVRRTVLQDSCINDCEIVVDWAMVADTVFALTALFPCVKVRTKLYLL